MPITNEWRVRDGAFDKSTWRANVFPLDHGVEQAPPYEAVLSYDASLPDLPRRPDMSVTLENGAVATFTVLESQEPSLAAVSPPPDDRKTVVELRVGRILSVSRPELHLLRDDVRPLIYAIRHGDTTEVQGSEICRLALWLLTSDGPLAPSLEEITLAEGQAVIGGRAFALQPAADGTTLRLPARVGDEVRISMRLRLQVTTPYRDRPDVREGPLPEFAFLKVFTDDGSLRVFGRALGGGDFEFGPFSVRSLRRLRYEVALPLDPPGDRPVLWGAILIRNGRPVEARLDSGQPLVLQAPPNLTLEALPSEVVRQAVECLDPDVGTVGDLMASDLVALYEIAPQEVEPHPDLYELALQAMGEVQDEVQVDNREETCQYPAHLSAGPGWNPTDAAVAQAHPSCATKFAEKVLAKVEPWGSRFAAKEEPLESEPDLTSVRPHAAAAAALAHALVVNGPGNEPAKLQEALRQQLAHLQSRHMLELARWSTWELLEVCELLKAVREPKATEMVRGLAQEAFRRFGVEQLAMREKLRIARLFTRPRTSDQPQLPRRPRQESKGMAGALEEDRRRYSCALQRALEEQRQSSRATADQKQWIGDFLDRWRDYLTRTHKGGPLQRFLPDLKADRERALKAVE
ncbi:MAG: hypothetical protein HYX97_05755 [Chloroflexi bacterium]|nr:hypothetical protein [Chloroflexota bacterium]